jgi:hypothetical protein
MLPKFQQFINERQYLHNVTPATVEWYTHAFKWLNTESPSQDELKDTVMRMRGKGLKATVVFLSVVTGNGLQRRFCPVLANVRERPIPCWFEVLLRVREAWCVRA